jgi:phosphate transport system substrate-binding protein
MKTKKLITVLVLALSVMLVFASCSSTTSEPSTAASESASTEADATTAPAASESESAAPSEEALSGLVQLSGSTSLEAVANALAEAFMNMHPDVTVDVQLGGSSVGIADVIAEKVDIGDASRELKDEELAEGAEPNVIAIDGIAVIVNPANGVSDLTTEQLAQIYKGEINNWSEVGGADAPIVVIGREAASGTRGAFEELLGVEDQCKYAQELNEQGAVYTAVTSTENAIGYISLYGVDENVKALTLNGVEATDDNIKAGDYVLSRPFIMATHGETSAVAQAFLDFVLSADGQAVVADNHLITVS